MNFILNNISTFISIFSIIITIYLSINYNKISNYRKKKDVNFFKNLGYNRILYFNLFWILPGLIFFIDIIIFDIIFKDKRLYDFIFNIFLFLLISNMLINVNKKKLNSKFELIKNMDKNNFYKKYYKRYYFKKIVITNYTYLYCVLYVIIDIIYYLDMTTLYTNIIIILSLTYFFMIIIYFVIATIDIDKAYVKTSLILIIDYRLEYNCILRTEIKNEKVLQINDDYINIYTIEDSVLHMINKSKVSYMTHKFILKLKDN